jgi:hypothetical protein
MASSNKPMTTGIPAAENAVRSFMVVFSLGGRI